MSLASSAKSYSILQRVALAAGTALVGWAERRARAAEQSRRRRRARALQLHEQRLAADRRREEALISHLLRGPRQF